MKKQRQIVFLLIMVIISTNSLGVFANNLENIPPGIEKYDIRILENGNYIQTPIKSQESKSKKALVPLRFILERSGYEVGWKPGEITIKKNIDGQVDIRKLNTKNMGYENKNVKGTILIDSDYFNSYESLKASYDMPTKTLILENNNLGKKDVRYYDFGKRKLRTSLDKDLEYRLQGGLALGEGEKLPLAIVLHGAHNVTKAEENRYDLGYSYLLKDLAQQGYAAISMNVNIQYSFEDGEPIGTERIEDLFKETILELKKINKGQSQLKDYEDLENKFDFDNVTLIGHSRSGQEIFNLANVFNKDLINIKGLISLAPSRIYEMDYSKTDLPVGIILPELDGDVTSLDGQWIYDELLNNKERESLSQLVFLYGANHNAFNQAILKQDEGKHWFEGEKVKISPKDQREFLKKYVRLFNKQIQEYADLELNQDYLYNQLGDYKMVVNNFKNGENIFDARKDQDYKSSARAKQVISSYNPQVNTAGLFNHPGDREKLELLNIKWNKKNQNIQFFLDKIDLKDKQYLNLYLAQDSTDKINNKKNQSFSLTIRDGKGREKNLVLKDLPALEYQEGQAIFDNTVYSSHTPLMMVQIPLKDLKDIDINNLSSIEFLFNQNNQGSIMIRRIDLI